MTTPPADARLVDDALELATLAADTTLRWFGDTDLAVERKGDDSPVTVADRTAEEVVRTELGRRRPHDTVVGEEAGTTVGTSGVQWVIDPIDGTRSFVRGVPLYSSLLAVFDEHGPAVGVITIPALGERVWAARGHGCHDQAGRAVSVNDTDRLDLSCVCSSAFDQPWWPGPALHRLTGGGCETRTWGDGYGYLLVATGRVEAMADPELELWDLAPMLTILPEAGGRISTWAGGEVTGRGSVLASNGAVHDAVLALLSG